jgi:GT2 family glycosyltransferase
MTERAGPEISVGAIKLCVIVVNYNAGALLTECVGAILLSEIAVEVVVSDNGSSDDSIVLLRECYGEDHRLTIIENGANLGFARGSNVAVHVTGAPYLLFLNPDCIVRAGILARMLAFMDATPEAGMSGCVVRDPGGSEQVASRRVIPDPWIGLARLLHIELLWPNLLAGKRLDRTSEPLPGQPIEVEAISGAFMLVRRQALKDVGLMDEGYFLHCEDLDWFVRFRRAGWRIYLVPDAEVVHHKGVCSVGRPMSVLWHKHKGMHRFFRKIQFRDYPLPISLLVLLGIWLHFAAVMPAAWVRQRLGKWIQR